MRIEFKPNKLTFDEAGFTGEIVKIVRRHLDELEIRYLEKMAEVIDDVDTKEYFKSVVKSLLKHIGEEISGGVVSYLAGADYKSEYDMIKAYVVAFGMGSKSTGPNGTHQAVYAGPPGRRVWDSMMDNLVYSNQEYYVLPDSWNHAGIDFVKEAMEMIRVHFNDMLESIFADIPDGMIARYIKVG